MLKSKWVNKGTVSGVVTVLSGVAAILSSLGGVPPDLLLSAIAILGGILTTKDSIDTRK